VASLSSFIARAALGAAMAFAATTAAAQASGQVFTCTNAKGQHLRSDRPIAECMDREQRVLAKDGSLLRVVAPTLTLQEMAEKNERDRRIAAEREARREAERADQLLVQRYPDEDSHGKARQAALEPLRASLAQSEQRVRTLAAERKPLAEEAEFYKDKPVPPKLRQRFDANDASTDAQRVLVANQQAEVARITALYDAELARLKRLWAGAAPGSLGPVATPKPGDARVAASPAGDVRK
jgi:hypothetical protein